jgi:hypothetical protein
VQVLTEVITQTVVDTNVSNKYADSIFRKKVNFGLKMEVWCSSERVVSTHETTLRHNAKDPQSALILQFKGPLIQNRLERPDILIPFSRFYSFASINGIIIIIIIIIIDK